jgi:type IV fimbrial biogenesis protein FimT
MTAILIGSVLLAMAVPSFRQMAASNRLTTQANDVVAALNFARSEAIKRNASIAFCRAATAAATACVTARDNWQYWIVRTAAGTVIRRGTISTYNNTLVMQSTLTIDQALFGSDGLTRTGGSLVNDHQITVCVGNVAASNIRRIVLGAGSRISTATDSGGC